jgi:hypothetical protein
MSVTLHHGDYRDVLPELGKFKMVFADPPDNIGLKYDGFEDKIEHYGSFITNLVCHLVDHAEISWLSFNAKWYPEVCAAISETGITKEFDCRFFVQTFTFGNNQRKDFTNGFRPLLRITKPGTKTYPKKVRVPSWRQENGDPRAAKGGKMPDDVWDFPRVTGNSSQRREWSPTQLHEGLYKRAIDFSCRKGAKVCDLFAGSGTMARVAGETHDVHLIELSDPTAQHIYEEHECERLLLLPIVLLCLLSTAQAQLIPGLVKGRPTAKDVERPDYLVQIKVDSVQTVPGLGRQSVSDWSTGSLVDPQYILTAKHNVEKDHKKITIGFKNGDFVEAEVVARHPTLDLLLLKLKTVRYEKTLELHPDVRRVRRGQTVKAIGFPGSGWDAKVDEYEGDVTPAILNIPGTELAMFRFRGMADQGVSGGPVLVGGYLVGVESATSPLGILCINTHSVRDFLQENLK